MIEANKKETMKLSELAEILTQYRELPYRNDWIDTGICLGWEYSEKYANLPSDKRSWWIYINSKRLKISFYVKDYDCNLRDDDYPNIDEIKQSLAKHTEELTRIGFIDDLEEIEEQ